MEITKLEEKKEYQEAKIEHDKMLSELSAGQKDLFALKSRLATLEENGGIDRVTGKPNWPEIEKVKKDYVEIKQRCDLLQEKVSSFPKYQEIQKQARPEAIKCGVEISKKIVKALAILEQCKVEYLELRKTWQEYAMLTGKVLDHEVESITGPYCGDNILHENTVRAFIESSEKYQKNLKANEQEKKL